MKVLAYTSDGKMTYCSAPPDKRGCGRCNHTMHKNGDETIEDFQNRLNYIMKSKHIVFDNVQQKIRDSRDKIDGALDKFIDNGYYYKFDSSKEFFEQRNSLSEEMACLISSCIKDFDYCDYTTEYIQDKKTGIYRICNKSKKLPA